MGYSKSRNFSELTMYKKSISLFQLARKVADYISDNKSVLEMYGSEVKIDKHADALVMYTMGLPTQIAAVESASGFELKTQKYNSLYQFEERIKKTCNLLIETKIAGHEFVELLKEELVQFQKLSRSYLKAS